MTNRGKNQRKLTDRMVSSLPVGSKPVQYTDTQVPGLTLTVQPSSHKSYAFKSSINGKSIHLHIGRAPGISVTEAREIATRYRACIDRGEDPRNQTKKEDEKPRFEKFVNGIYLPNAKKTKRSHEADESKFRIHMLPHFGRRYLADITSKEIAAYLDKLASTLKPATRNRHLMLLRSVYGLAIEQGVFQGDNPAAKIKQLREDNQIVEYLEIDEISRFLASADRESNLVAVAAIKFLLFTGLRRNEALKAKWADYNPDLKQLHLKTTKNKRERFVPLNDMAIAVLEGINSRHKGQYIFPGRDPSKPLNNPRKCFDRILKAARIKPMRLHGLRHNFGSHAAMAGMSTLQIQNLLGHRSVASTTRYAHFSQDKLRESSNVVANVFNKQPN